MNKNSRTKNSIINSIYAFSAQLITLILNFIVRTVFVKVLSAEYLGVNGLFTNIITMLSLADLGIGISIPYTLYRPLAEDNKEKIKALMKLYSKIYNVIGLVVLIVGISITPFLKYIIKEMPNIPEINLVYILFVINSACSYFFVYKKLLLDSDQKAFIASRIIMIATVIKSIIEIIVLYITKNYIAYLLVSIIITIIQNLVISLKCNKIYPYLKESSTEKVSKEDINSLKKNTSALIIYRIGVTALNGTDSIILSKFIGVVAVGIYSNYLLITNAITNVISQIFSAITSSIGNLVVTTEEKKSEEILHKLQFLSFWLYTFFSVCVIALINPFIKLWIGSEYLLDNYTAFAVGLNLYVLGMQNVISSFRNAYGLFVQGKYRPVIMTIVNIVLSIWWAKTIGILGVILATVFSRLFIMGIYDPIVVFKYGLRHSPKRYFITYAKYLAIFIALSALSMYVVNLLVIDNFFTWIIIGILLAILINIILFIMFYKSDNLIFYKDKLKNVIKDIRTR